MLTTEQIALLPDIEESPLAGAEFPRQSLVPAKEWLYPGHQNPLDEIGNLRAVARILGVVSWGGRDRPIFAIVTGWGPYTDCLHTYPKDHWTKEEAEQFHRMRMEDPAWTPPKNDEVAIIKSSPNFAELLKQAPKEMLKGSIQCQED